MEDNKNQKPVVIPMLICVVVLWLLITLLSGDSRKSDPMYQPYYKNDGSFDYKQYDQDVKEGEFYYNLQQELKNK
jgi:hypothetical protein